MISLSDHNWKQSSAADRLMAQVAGMAPSCARKNLFVILQAFFDESYNDGGVFVLAGHIAKVDAWRQFSAAWEEMLPQGTRNQHGKWHFKMSEMAQSPERMARVPIFFQIVERHVLASVSCKIDMGELQRAKNRIYVPNLEIDWNFYATPYRVAFQCLLDMFHANRPLLKKEVQEDARIDFYFDNISEKKPIRDAWDYFIETRLQERRHLYGVEPRFEDDSEFVALQGADLWAWWVRKWYADGTPEKIGSCDIGIWKETRKDHPKINFTYSEDQLTASLISTMRSQIEPGRPIYDVRFFRGDHKA